MAPTGVDLDACLTGRFGPEVARIVRALHAEHIALDRREHPDVTGVDRWTLWASAADKIVSLRSILRRANHAPDPVAYWRRRRAFVIRVPYFVAFADAAVPHLPVTMGRELLGLIRQAAQATAPYA